MARLEVDGSIYNVRRSKIRTRLLYPRIVRDVLGSDEATPQEVFYARTFAFMMLDTEHVSGEQRLPLVDGTNDLSGEVLQMAWDAYQELDAVTFPNDFWAAHSEANDTLNEADATPTAERALEESDTSQKKETQS